MFFHYGLSQDTEYSSLCQKKKFYTAFMGIMEKV